MGTNFFRRDDRDPKFVLFETLDLQRLLQYEAFKDFSLEDFKMILDEGLKVAREAIGPTLQDGDQQGLVYDQGRVKVPASFHDCWKVLSENGWHGLAASQEHGGQGLPLAIYGQVAEYFISANTAIKIYSGLAIGAGHLIETFGTGEDKALFCEKMFTGIWGGTMCLTEPEAGSDVGYLRTKAVPDPSAGDPRIYKIEGTKRFISGGEQDLTENIIHLVLARIEGAPSGTKGISLFIVPKIWVHPDGSLGEPNDVFCTNIEHKMGLHGSATCGLSFGENGRCRGFLLGEPHSGIAKMFQMMNEARIGTGLLAQGVAASAYDAARYYARERLQGPPFTARSTPRVRIIEHEDVRRMLMMLKAGTEAMRAFVLKLFYLTDISNHDPDEKVRQETGRTVDLLTPLVKAYCSDFAYLLCREAIQVLGGVGYCREFPVEQYTRDVKSASIYEGTTYIQSLDLIGRKLMMAGGAVFQGWLENLMDFAQTHQEDPDFAQDFDLLNKAGAILRDYAERLMHYFQDGRLKLIPLSATRFQECMSEAVLAQLMLEQGLVARDKLKTVDPASANGIFYRGKMETVRFFCRNILTNVFSRHAALRQEDMSAVDIPEEAF
ncbi:MAG: acyl-CoA dehydrogenase C-terminal domain-containing protein [Deltaproteobacteria bacterium]|nr:acyl-CoA dehydrogenase C-terminal domain-containing protein [Deltaproteobacteria bacterium]